MVVAKQSNLRDGPPRFAAVWGARGGNKKGGVEKSEIDMSYHSTTKHME